MTYAVALMFAELELGSYESQRESVIRRFDNVKATVEGLAPKIDAESLTTLYGIRWTKALVNADDGNSRAQFRGPIFERSLLYLKEAAASSTPGAELTLTAPAVAAIMTGRAAMRGLAQSPLSDDLQSLDRLRFAGDGTRERVEIGLRLAHELGTNPAARQRALEFSFVRTSPLPHPRWDIELIPRGMPNAEGSNVDLDALGRTERTTPGPSWPAQLVIAGANANPADMNELGLY